MKNETRMAGAERERGNTVRDGAMVGGVRVVRMKTGTSAPVPQAPVVVSAAGGSGGLGLSELVDRASAQLMILRRTLEEATALGNAARRESDGIATQIVHAQRSREQIEERIRQAGTALSVMDRAGETVKTLEDVVARIRGVREAMQSEMERRLESQRQAFDARIEQMTHELAERLERQEEEWVGRFGRLEALMDGRFGEVERAIPVRIAEVRDRAMEQISLAAESARAKGDGMVAELDRRSAQAEARANIVLDAAQERVMDLERAAERTGESVREQIEDLKRCATGLMGVNGNAIGEADAWRGHAPVGSMGALVLRAETVMQSASRATERLESATRDAETITAKAVGESTGIATRLEAALTKSDGRSLLLEKCMEDATSQAESMMVVARDLGALIERAHAVAGAPAIETARSVKARKGAGREGDRGPASAAA